MFYYYLLFQLTNEINSFIEKIKAIITIYTLQTKLRIAPMSRSSRQYCRVSRASRDGRAAGRARRDVLCRTSPATQHV